MHSSNSDHIIAIVESLYECLSGAGEVERNWPEFLSLFHPEARMMIMYQNNLSVLTAAQYRDFFREKIGDGMLKEYQISAEIRQDGLVAHVWSHYETIYVPDDKELTYSGFNSIQLIKLEGEWKVIQVLWDRKVSL
jgi:hypothetical protein